MKIVFAGTPEFAERQLEALLQTSHEIVAVYTQPDRPKGRGQVLHASPVKTFALQQGLEVKQPLNFKNDEDVIALNAFKADLLVVAAYGLILPQRVLDLFPLGAINVHASLLPRWRGAAPIHRAILAGDTQTGITLMQMELGLDTGAMLSKSIVPILSDDNTASLHDKLADAGAVLLKEYLSHSEHPAPQKQNEAQVTYAHKLTKEEGTIDWSKSALEIDRQIRAFNPFPIAFTHLDDINIRLFKALPIENTASNASPGTIVDNTKLGIDVATGKGLIRIQSFQLPGKKQLSWSDCYHQQQSFFAKGQCFK